MSKAYILYEIPASFRSSILFYIPGETRPSLSLGQHNTSRLENPENLKYHHHGLAVPVALTPDHLTRFSRFTNKHGQPAYIYIHTRKDVPTFAGLCSSFLTMSLPTFCCLCSSFQHELVLAEREKI